MRAQVEGYRKIRTMGSMSYISVGQMIRDSPIEAGDTVRVVIELADDGEGERWRPTRR